MDKKILLEISRLRELMSLQNTNLLIESIIDDIVKRAAQGASDRVVTFMKQMGPDILIRLRNITGDFSKSFDSLNPAQQDDFLNKLIQDSERKFNMTLTEIQKINLIRRIRNSIVEVDDLAKTTEGKKNLLKGADDAATTPKPDAGSQAEPSRDNRLNTDSNNNKINIDSKTTMRTPKNMTQPQKEIVEKAQRLIGNKNISEYVKEHLPMFKGKNPRETWSKITRYFSNPRFKETVLPKILWGVGAAAIMITIYSLLWEDEEITEEMLDESSAIENEGGINNPEGGDNNQGGINNPEGGDNNQGGINNPEGGSTESDDNERIYTTKGDPYMYKVIDNMWYTKGGPKGLKDLVSLEKFNGRDGRGDALGILDARHPEARKVSTQIDSSNVLQSTTTPPSPTSSTVDNQEGEVEYFDVNN